MSEPSEPRPRAPGSDARVRSVATDFLALRPVIVAPFLLMAITTLAVSGARRGQVIALACFGTLALGAFSWERRAGRRRLVTAPILLRSLVATLAGLTFASAATGAMQSPFLPMLFAPLGVGFAAFGRGRSSNALLAALGVALLGLAALTPIVAHLAVPGPARSIVLGAAIVDAAILLHVGVGSLTAAHARSAEALAAAGDEMVRAAQGRARSMELLGAKVAHEVKNPLAAIRALVEVMLESADARAAKRLTVAAAEVARIEKLVDGYGSLAHPLDVVRREVVDVSELTVALGALLEARAERRGVVLTVTPSSIRFSLDRDRVKEALLNLVLNALEATPPGGTVTVSCAPSGDGLAIFVSDTGAGMSAATLARLGTAFFTEREGGTGLGVLLARQVAAQHAGRLDFLSDQGRGTTATLVLGRDAARHEGS